MPFVRGDVEANRKDATVVQARPAHADRHRTLQPLRPRACDAVGVRVGPQGVLLQHLAADAFAGRLLQHRPAVGGGEKQEDVLAAMLLHVGREMAPHLRKIAAALGVFALQVVGEAGQRCMVLVGVVPDREDEHKHPHEQVEQPEGEERAPRNAAPDRPTRRGHIRIPLLSR